MYYRSAWLLSVVVCVGQRGVASILFLMIAVDHEEMSRLTEIEAVVYVTVFLSIILHGATAAPFSRRYGESAAARIDGKPV